MTEPTATARATCFKVDPAEAAKQHHPHMAVIGPDRRWHMLAEDSGLICRAEHPALEIPPDTRTVLAIAAPHRVRCSPEAPLRRAGHKLTTLWPEVHFQIPDELPERWPRARAPRWYVWAVLYRLQQGRCAVCQNATPSRVDHDHANRRVRGLVCASCNVREWTCKHDPYCIAEYIAAPPAWEFGWTYNTGARAVRRKICVEEAPAPDGPALQPAPLRQRKRTWGPDDVPENEEELRAQINSLVSQVAHREGLDQQAVNTQIIQSGYPSRKTAQLGGLLRIRDYLVKRIAKPIRLRMASPEAIAKELARLTPKRRAEIAEQVEREQADRMRRWDAIAEEAGRDPAPDPEEYSHRLTVAFDRYFPDEPRRAR